MVSASTEGFLKFGLETFIFLLLENCEQLDTYSNIRLIILLCTHNKLNMNQPG